LGTIDDKSKLDRGQQQRKAYKPTENAAGVTAVNRLIPSKFSRQVITWCCGNPVQIKYYDDVVAEIHKVTAVACVAGSLCSTYFTIYSAKDATKFHVWYDVGCGGVDPAPACSTGIEVNLTSGDAASVVALATSQQVNANANFCTCIQSGSTLVTITNAAIGYSTPASDTGCTGFTFCHFTACDNRQHHTVCITFDACNNPTNIDRTDN
jgi:TPP-dependent trihydroxycyclohexane-1,2-dione (THcHDO) dehydratase